MIRTFFNKAYHRLNSIFLKRISNTFLQFRVYKSYWHFISRRNFVIQREVSKTVYIAQKPNYGAGIGHQLANWNAGYYFASYFNRKFAHFMFSNIEWETFLGFGEREVKALDLIKDHSYKKVKLPRFDEHNTKHVNLIRKIINSYSNEKVLFLLAKDQGYQKQYETMHQLSDKFFNAAARKDDQLFYDKHYFNIAIHIRRGDIVAMKENNLSNGNLRWLDNSYYVEVLKNVLKGLETIKEIKVYLFSQGIKDDFKEFDGFSNIQYCLEVNQYDTFLHLVNADLLITSKSSFSYKPALISKGIKVCPKDFWHSYPKDKGWILTNHDGSITNLSDLKHV